MRTRAEIKAIAKEAMGQQRGTSILLVLSVLAFSVLMMAASFLWAQSQPLLYWVVYLVLMIVVVVWMVGVFGAFIKIYQGKETGVGEVAASLKVNFLRKLGANLWMMLWIYLWSLLFVIPGIIKALAYYFTPNVLADCPNVTARQALKISMRITKGHKGKVFLLILSWIGWYILCGLTLGILYIVHVGPYWYATDAGFYLELRDQAIREGKLTWAELGKEEPQGQGFGQGFGQEQSQGFGVGIDD